MAMIEALRSRLTARRQPASPAGRHAAGRLPEPYPEPPGELTGWERIRIGYLLAKQPSMHPLARRNGSQLADFMRRDSPHDDFWLAHYLFVVLDCLEATAELVDEPRRWQTSIEAIAAAVIELTALERL